MSPAILNHKKALSGRDNEGGGVGLASVSGQSFVTADPRDNCGLSSGLSFIADGRSGGMGIGNENSLADHGE